MIRKNKARNKVTVKSRNHFPIHQMNFVTEEVTIKIIVPIM
jgi:hypothetical protein